ncbi:MAG: hypothetical protein ACXW11_00140 [Methylotenera sp.]
MTSPIDPFFERIYDGDWNACVGIQGDAENYVDGYLEAALELAGAVIDKNLVGSRDTLAMPILYNCRHGLELSLKYAINRLHKTGMILHTHQADHDIGSHWQHLQEKAVGGVSALGDTTLRQLIIDLEPYVKSLAAIDDDGQELRYAQNREGETSLKDISIVNLPHVRKSIEKLSELLQRLKQRVHEIVDERSTNTFTSNCSRKDLEEIAKIMGDCSTWVDQSFIDNKDIVMERFGIKSGKFSDAIDAIRCSGPLAALIGNEASLKYLSDEKAIELLTLWVKHNPLITQVKFDDLGTDYFNRDWDKHFESMNRAKILDKATLKLLTLEEFGDLETVYYLGLNRVFGEHYERQLGNTISNYAKPLSMENVHHIMTKTNLLEAFADGCERVGRPSLAKKIRLLRPMVTDISNLLLQARS